MDNTIWDITDEGELVLKTESGDFTVKVNLYDHFQNEVNDEQRMRLAEAIGWDNVYKYVIDRLCHDDTGHCWQYPEKDVLKVMSRMEQQFSKHYFWGAVENLNRMAKNMSSHEQIYWTLYHGTDWGAEWLRKHGIESNYTTEMPDIDNFRKMIQREFRNYTEKTGSFGEEGGK